MRENRLTALFRDFARADNINRENLRRILKDNRNTAYGRRMAFDQIGNVELYRKHIPFTDYEDYDGLCEPMRYTAYPILYRLATSGSAGEQKRFPLTSEALCRYGSYICDMPYYHYGGQEGPHLHTSVFRCGQRENILLSAAYHEWLKEQGLFDTAAYVGGGRLLFAEDIGDVPYVKAWLMLCTPQLVSIQSIFLYDVLLILHYLEENWVTLLLDMRKRKIGAALPQEVQEQLLACLPEPSVLNRMEAVLSEGFETPVLPRLFPGLRFINGIGGGSMAFQTKALARYAGDIPVCYFAYASSECMMGIALHPGRAEYALLPYSAYYEFLREDGVCVEHSESEPDVCAEHSESEPDVCVELSELEPGVCYEPVITTFSGLYRYRTGDIIRICRYEGQTPVFEVAGRKRTINIAGEKLSERVLHMAFAEWAGALGVTLSDYAVGTERAVPGRYLIFMEIVGEAFPGRKADSAGRTGDFSEAAGEKISGGMETAAEIFDAVLKKLSTDYRDIRELGMLRGPRLIPCRPGSIAEAAAGEGHRKQHLFLKETQTFRLLCEWDEKKL